MSCTLIKMNVLASLAFSRWCREHDIGGVQAKGAGVKVPDRMSAQVFPDFKAEYPTDDARRAYLRAYLLPLVKA